MQLCKIELPDGDIQVGVVAEDQINLLALDGLANVRSLAELLHAPQPAALVRELLPAKPRTLAVADVTLRAPLDHQEVWAAGVTYKRSREARERESQGAARFYDLVYEAARPELFFKAAAARVADPGAPVRIRRDSRWSVPEPELALILSPQLEIIGYTIGNDMSARDIEGENPLYLPQAKVYDGACALGPVITLAENMPPFDQVIIRLLIERQGKPIFEGAAVVADMARSFDDLADWLGREISFPHGVVLLTGTGVVPPDDFTLIRGDVINIDITGIGRLTNIVETRS
jgi:2-dehydro-3-deoxy-D-arabinonate dehydratase